MKIVFSSDIHGRTSQYDELVEFALRESARALALGGDLLPPPRGLSSPAGREDAAKQQAEYFERDLVPRLEAAKRHGMHILLLLGNYDLGAVAPRFEECSHAQGFLTLHQRCRDVDGVTFAGLSSVNHTPFPLKDWETWDRAEGEQIDGAFDHRDPRAILTRPAGRLVPIAAQLESLAAMPGGPAAERVYVLHAPPHGTGLDVVARGAPPVGSRAIREFIARHAPRLTLHGHIHESPHISGTWAAPIGTTLAIQPGQSPDQLHAVVVDTDDPAGTARHTVFGRFDAARGRNGPGDTV